MSTRQRIKLLIAVVMVMLMIGCGGPKQDEATKKAVISSAKSQLNAEVTNFKWVESDKTGFVAFELTADGGNWKGYYNKKGIMLEIKR